MIPASGNQDHTISPSASAPLVSRLRSVHRIPHPTIVTMAEAPLQRVRDGRTIRLICTSDKANYFSFRGLTAISENQPSGKSVRHRCPLDGMTNTLISHGIASRSQPWVNRGRACLRSEHANPLRAAHADRTGGAAREVKCNPTREWATVINHHGNRRAGLRIRHRYL